TESFQLLAGEPAKDDIFDGVDTTWSRIPGGEDVGPRIDSLIAKFNPQSPVERVPDLLSLRSKLATLPSSNLVHEKQVALDRILQSCLELTVETTVARAEVVPGEKLELHERVQANCKTPIKWLGVRYPGETDSVGDPLDLKPNAAAE